MALWVNLHIVFLFTDKRGGNIWTLGNHICFSFWNGTRTSVFFSPVLFTFYFLSCPRKQNFRQVNRRHSLIFLFIYIFFFKSSENPFHSKLHFRGFNVFNKEHPPFRLPHEKISLEALTTRWMQRLQGGLRNWTCGEQEPCWKQPLPLGQGDGAPPTSQGAGRHPRGLEVCNMQQYISKNNTSK